MADTNQDGGQEPIDDPADQLLDPFGFHWHWSSRFQSLGGEEPAADPSYVFHTEYLDLPLGAAQFQVEFTDLRATVGAVIFIVHAFDGNQDVVRHFETTVPVRELVERQGRITLGISAKPGYKHALLAHSYGEMDGECTGITVKLIHQRPLVLPTTKAPVHQPPFNATGLLVSSRRPLFSHPVSQAYTAEQLEEPLFAGLALEHRRPGETDPQLWQRLMPRRILDHYGALREGACLLQMGQEKFGVAQSVRDHGGQVVEMGSQSSRRESDPANLVLFPGEFHNHFDMVVSSIKPAHVGSTLIWLRQVVDSALCLREGGLGIYTCQAALQEGANGDQDYALSRVAIERLCVKLMSRKLDVAEIRYGIHDGNKASGDVHRETVPFFLIVSKTIPSA